MPCNHSVALLCKSFRWTGLSLQTTRLDQTCFGNHSACLASPRKSLGWTRHALQVTRLDFWTRPSSQVTRLDLTCLANQSAGLGFSRNLIGRFLLSLLAKINRLDSAELANQSTGLDMPCKSLSLTRISSPLLDSAVLGRACKSLGWARLSFPITSNLSDGPDFPFRSLNWARTRDITACNPFG